MAVALVGASDAAAHFPHDPMAEVALRDDTVVVQYLFPRRRLLLVSDDAGRSWTYSAPEALAEVLQTLEFASPGVLFAADGATTSPFRSDDTGRTWSACAEPDGTPVRCVAPSPAFAEDPLLFAGTDAGLFRSHDGGESWSATGLEGGAVDRIALAPGFPDDPFVAVVHDHGVWVSGDAGSTWQIALGDVEATALALSPDFATDHRLWAGTWTGWIATSNDRGHSWQEVELDVEGVGALSEEVNDLIASDGERVLAITPSYAVVCSMDGGASWELCSEGLPPRSQQYSSQWGHYRRLAGAQEVALAAWEGLVVSDDGGLTWAERCTIGPTYERAIAFSPSYPDDPTLWVGAYGSGLYETSSGGESWSVVEGLHQHLFLEAVTASPAFPDDPRMMLVSSRRLMRSEDGGVTFASVEVADIEYLHAVVPVDGFEDNDVAYAVGTTGDEGVWSVARSSDGGATWTSVWTGEDALPQIQRVRPFPAATDLLVASQTDPPGLLTSADGGQSWAIGQELQQDVTALFAFDDEGDQLLAVTEGGQLWRGLPWESEGELGADVVFGFRGVAGDEPPPLFLSLDPPGLLRSLDGGHGWDAIEVPFASTVLTVAVPPDYPLDPTLVASTHYGSFFSCDQGETWSLLDTHLRYEDDACELRYRGSGWAPASPAAGTGGSASFGEQAGDSVEVTFRGRGVRWIAWRGPGLGRAAVIVDGTQVDDVSLDASDLVRDQAVFEMAWEEDGFHTLVIEITEPGAGVVVDAVEVVRHTVVNGSESYEIGQWCVDLPDPDGGCCPSSCEPRPIEVETSVAAMMVLGGTILVRRRR